MGPPGSLTSRQDDLDPRADLLGGQGAADGSDVSSVGEDTQRRFGGLDRLYGEGTIQALAQLHVVVAGIGGVGAWCVEALARSGVGALTLVDLDHVAESNINRQVHALGSTLGQAKVLAMAARVRDIHPGCVVRCVDDFVDPDNVAQILSQAAGESQNATQMPFGTAGGARDSAQVAVCHVLVDCTDQVAAKVAMVLEARRAGWKVLTCGGAGGKGNPLALRLGDLAQVGHDALLGRVRQTLRKHHGYPRGGTTAGKPLRRVPRMGVPCLWFDEEVVLPQAWRTAPGASVQPGPQGLSCAGYGSAVAVTATMGMMAADWAIHQGLAALR